MVSCAVVSGITAIAALSVLPFLNSFMDMFELTEHGTVRLADAVASSQESFMVLDANFIVLRGNDASKSLFGPNYVGSSILELIWDPEDVLKVRSILLDLKSSREPNVSGLVEFKAYGDGELSEDFRWLESTLQKKPPKSGRSGEFEIIVTTRNINERKKTEMYRAMLEASKEQEQERINAAKMMFVTCVAHDLKTPLQSFTFALNLFSQTSLTAEQSEIIRNAQVSVDLMKLTVSQAIHISKVQTGVAVVPRKSSISLSEVIQRIKIIMDGYGSPVPISYYVSDTLVDGIISDEEWLWQMVLNLLTNACKYTTTGFIRVTWEEADKGTMLLCSVSDTGIGIEESKFSSLFGAFNQAQVGQMEGTGLGLFSLRSRAEALGGSCGIRNNVEYGRGCTVWFKVPYVQDTSARFNDRMMASVHGPTTPSSVGGGGRISSSTSSLLSPESPPLAQPQLQQQLHLTSSGRSTPSFPSSTSSRPPLSRRPSNPSVTLHQMMPDGFVSEQPQQSTFHKLALNNETIVNVMHSPASPLTALQPHQLPQQDYTGTVFSTSSPHSSASSFQFSNSINSGNISSNASIGEQLSKPVNLTVATHNSLGSSMNSDVSGGLLCSGPPPPPSLTAMVIDDVLPIRKLMTRVLLNLGFTSVECYENGLKGLEAMKQKMVDIVFTDIQMPILTGPEVRQHLILLRLFPFSLAFH